MANALSGELSCPCDRSCFCFRECTISQRLNKRRMSIESPYYVCHLLTRKYTFCLKQRNNVHTYMHVNVHRLSGRICVLLSERNVKVNRVQYSKGTVLYLNNSSGF